MGVVIIQVLITLFTTTFVLQMMGDQYIKTLTVKIMDHVEKK